MLVYTDTYLSSITLAGLNMEYQERHSPCSISSQLSTRQAKLTKLPWWCIVELVMSYIYSLWSILLLTLYILFYTSIVWIRWWTLLINVAGCFFNFLNRHDELSCVCVLLLLDQSVNTDIDMCWLHVGEWYTCRPICICAYTVAVTIVSPLTVYYLSAKWEAAATPLVYNSLISWDQWCSM